MRDGREIPVDDASSEGITFFGETSAWPRRTSILLKPISPGAKAKLPQIRRRHNLGPNEFRVTIQRMEATSHVLLAGLDPEGLPNGTWEFANNVYPLGVHRAGRIDIPENGQAPVRVPLGREPGEIAVKDALEWNDEIVRVLGASQLDEGPGADGENGIAWAQNEERRARRRACVFNVLAVCRELGLIDHVNLVFFAEVDRIYTNIEPDFLSELDGARFNVEGPPAHPIHWRLLNGLGRRRPENTGSYCAFDRREVPASR